ncbi:MFS transporter [Tardiphaga sp. P9-11]|uniref:MFS transporter n=1 Tax=Tardiphaga sp. P9-11 TaxID=2024614 RepID=UPI0011F2E1A1|nr:MFS transporter [Tardiphaga sp. P9-11]KAA0074466.1 MFS transporter [Tardiphaga sp. P9-11]
MDVRCVPAGSLLRAAAILLLALNLRPAIAAIGPLLDLIEASTGLTHTEASLLTTLPVLVMGLCALFGAHLRRLLGERGGIAIGAAIVFVACLARVALTGREGLIWTAILVGIGIALVQTLLPTFIKREFPMQSGRIMGVYTTGIMGGAAIAAATAAGLAEHLGWPATLAVWCIPAALAVLFWLMATWRGKGGIPSIPQPRTVHPRCTYLSFWRSLRAWELLVFFGIGTGAYTLVLAWLPPFYTALGWSRSDAGFLLGGLTITEVVAGLMVSAFIGRFPDRRGPLIVVLALLLTGLICLIAAPLSLAVVACGLLGTGIGALFPLSLILTLDHIDDPARAGELASFVQGGGYIIASAMPLLAGILRDQFSDLSQAWMVMAAGALLPIGMSTRFSPASYLRLSR